MCQTLEVQSELDHHSLDLITTNEHLNHLPSHLPRLLVRVPVGAILPSCCAILLLLLLVCSVLGWLPSIGLAICTIHRCPLIAVLFNHLLDPLLMPLLQESLLLAELKACLAILSNVSQGGGGCSKL
jgi:hypothetical protein